MLGGAARGEKRSKGGRGYQMLIPGDCRDNIQYSTSATGRKKSVKANSTLQVITFYFHLVTNIYLLGHYGSRISCPPWRRTSVSLSPPGDALLLPSASGPAACSLRLAMRHFLSARWCLLRCRHNHNMWEKHPSTDTTSTLSSMKPTPAAGNHSKHSVCTLIWLIGVEA